MEAATEFDGGINSIMISSTYAQIGIIQMPAAGRKRPEHRRYHVGDLGSNLLGVNGASSSGHSPQGPKGR
ncbi:hypothetical protein ACLH0K_16890 [Arthrobacter sp. MPF02]|uniref:hypothetical protein n=1 Tax=Arthrobacter sp. MPF02 TaxID=3388492 RepID=UPI003984C655